MKSYFKGLIRKASELIPFRRPSPFKDYRHNIVQTCRVCNDITHPFQEAYGRFWYRCKNCNFLQAEVSKAHMSNIDRGQGFSAGTGIGGGGFREHWLCDLFFKELNCSKILLYGTGNTLTFQKLFEKGYDIWGCDIYEDLVAKRQEKFGERFFHAKKIPQIKFDAIVAVEVLEHLISPIKIFNLFAGHLKADGIIAGTTDFYEGGDISDHIYIKPNLHIAYWSRESITKAASMIGLGVDLFELECPGSMYPDEKFGLLWPRKRVFFAHTPKMDAYFNSLADRYKILPINKP